MADRFDEMARAWLGLPPDRMGLDDELPTLSALLRKVHDEARSEADRLRKLFDDAGQGEHNVLALVDHYQRTAMEADERLLAARKVVEAARRARISERDCEEVRRADALGRALAEYDKAVEP